MNNEKAPIIQMNKVGVIPAKFNEKIIGAYGESAKAWLETLADRTQTILDQWDLMFEADVPNLSYNYVIKVVDSNETPLILKLGVPNSDFRNEINSVQEYDGRGFARLLKADPEQGTMLLERVEPGTMLSAELDEELVIQQFIHVWKAIRRPLPEGFVFPTIMNWADGLKRYEDRYIDRDGPISMEFVGLARDYFQEINETSAGPELLHGDLHHENILYSEQRGWIAIDPKGLAGDPYYDVVSFLINHLHTKADPKALLKRRVDIVCTELGFDRERFLKAAVAMATLYACWGVEDQSEWENTFQCAQWFYDFLL